MVVAALCGQPFRRPGVAALPVQPLALQDEDLRRVALRVELVAKSGVLSIDSSRLHIRSVTRDAFAPAETTVTARDGVAWAYLRPRPPRKGVRAQGASVAVTLAGPAGRAPATVETLRLPAPARGAARDWSGFVRAMPEGVPLAGAPGPTCPARSGWLWPASLSSLAPEQLRATPSGGLTRRSSRTP